MAELHRNGMSGAPRLLRRALLAGGARRLVAGLLPVTAACTWPPAGRGQTPGRPLRLLAEGAPGREARVRAWNREHAPQLGATLELLGVPDGIGNATTREAILASSSGADIIWGALDSMPALALQGALSPLATRVRADRLDLKRFMPPALQPAFGIDGRLTALPEEVDARQVYFNRDHFEAAGVDLRAAGFDFERPAMTWEALRRVNLDLLAAPRTRERTPFLPGHAGAPLELWGWQNGAQWLQDGGRRASFSRPEGIEALAWLVSHTRELGNADHALAGEFPPVARHGDASDAPPRHPFLQTAVSVCFESTRFVSTLAGWHAGFPLGYVEPPRRSDSRPIVSLSRAWGYALRRDAPDAAWHALRFLVSEGAAITAAASGAARAPLAPPLDPLAPVPRRPLPPPGRPLWYPPYTGQLDLDRRLAQRYRTGSKLLDEAHDHGLEQLRHARFHAPCPAPDAVWPLLAEALREGLRGAAAPADALKRAEREAQARLDAAWLPRPAR